MAYPAVVNLRLPCASEIDSHTAIVKLDVFEATHGRGPGTANSMCKIVAATTPVDSQVPDYEPSRSRA